MNPIFKRHKNTVQLFGQNPYESIYGLESECISFFAIEYEYNYPMGDMNLSPKATASVSSNLNRQYIFDCNIVMLNFYVFYFVLLHTIEHYGSTCRLVMRHPVTCNHIKIANLPTTCTCNLQHLETDHKCI